MPVRPTVDFTWSPRIAAAPVQLNANTYPYTMQADAVARSSDSRYASWSTFTGSDITFSASITLPKPDLSVVEYRWLFGDGDLGFGPTVTHVYKVAFPQLTVSLIITDTLGQVTSRSQIIGLTYAEKGTLLMGSSG